MAPKWGFGIARELSLVEDRLRDCLQSDVSKLTEIASYVVQSGGKRIRPTVAILCFKAVDGTEIEKVVEIATAIELIHTGSLVHDDINDGSSMRRGKVSAFKKFGLMDSLVTGDFLFSKGYELGGKFSDEIVQVTADACSSLAAGEILQRRFQYDTSLTVEKYYELAERKTARLLSAGARAGALVGNGSGEQVELLGEYGRNLGIAFQIVDDILDVEGDEEKLGKRVGMDVREGNVSLPCVYAMSRGSDGLGEELASILKKKEKSEEEVERGLQIIKEVGGTERAFQDADKHTKIAKDQVSSFEGERGDRLLELADFILNRDR
jgi:geranylgeranyl pyrophosphate synthase